jgi:peptide/nickel transport system ATP-binding protein
MHDDIALQASDLALWFDASEPWLVRTLRRKPKRTLKAVDGVSFAVPRGSTFAIVGESGCGKSTIARLAVRALHAANGHLTYSGSHRGHDGERPSCASK